MTLNIQNKQQWKKAFFEACKTGYLEELRHLCQKKYLDLGWSNIHWDDDYGFISVCGRGQLEVVQYFLTSPELIEAGHTFADLHAWDESGFRLACQNGHLDVVQYLLTSPELIEAGHTWADLHALDESGFRLACKMSHFDVVKYLLTSPELKKAGHDFANVHAEYDYGFSEACYQGQWELVRWLVIDYGLEKTPSIEDIIQNYPQAQEYFRVHEELKEIQEVIKD